MNTQQTFDFSSFPTLTTERLILRRPILADASDMLEYLGDAYVQRFNMEPLKTVKEAEHYISHGMSKYFEEQSIQWGVTLKREDKVFGGFGLHSWSRHHRRAEVGYDSNRAYWGNGYATEALRAVLTFAFEQMNLNYIYAGTIADNHESVRMLETFGFTREGTRRSYSWEDDGTFHDGAMYSMLRHEFFDLAS